MMVWALAYVAFLCSGAALNVAFSAGDDAVLRWLAIAVWLLIGVFLVSLAGAC